MNTLKPIPATYREILYYTRAITNEIGLELDSSGYIYLQGSDQSSPLQYNGKFLKYSFDEINPAFLGSVDIMLDMVNDVKMTESLFVMYLEISRLNGDFETLCYYTEYDDNKRSRVCVKTTKRTMYSDYFRNPCLKYGDFILKQANVSLDMTRFEVLEE